MSTRCNVCSCIFCCAETSSLWFTDPKAQHRGWRTGRDRNKWWWKGTFCLKKCINIYDCFYMCAFVCECACVCAYGSDGHSSRKDPPCHPLTHSRLWPQTPLNGSLMETRLWECVLVCVRFHMCSDQVVSIRMSMTDSERQKEQTDGARACEYKEINEAQKVEEVYTAEYQELLYL